MLKKKKVIVLIASSVALLSLTYGCAQPAQSKVSGNNTVTDNSAKKLLVSGVSGNIAEKGDTDIETNDDANGQDIETNDNANDKDIESNDDVNGADNEVNDEKSAKYTGQYKSKIYGKVEKIPANNNGEWNVGGKNIIVTKDTLIDEEEGKVKLGSFVEIKGNYSNNKFIANEIEAGDDETEENDEDGKEPDDD